MVYDLSAERHPAKIDGLPPAPSRECSWNPLEKAEELVQAAARDHALVELRREKLQKETAEKPHKVARGAQVDLGAPTEHSKWTLRLR
jgi:hypothetical protein